MKFTIIKSCLARFSGIFALGTPSYIHGTAISYRCAKFSAFVSSVTILTLRDLTMSKGVFERRTPIRSGLFVFMSKFIKRKYSHSTNVVASHDGTLKWKSPHFRLTCAVQKRLCLSSLLGQLTTPENTITYHNTLC